MRNATSSEHYVVLGDWRGHCTWISDPTLHITIGGFIWENLSVESQTVAKQAFSRVAALGERQQIEVVDQQGNRFRNWIWPLDCPEVAVCALGIRLPRNLVLLTERERECLEFLSRGVATRQIAAQLDVSASTVQTHMKRAREKLGLRSVEALISYAAKYCHPSDELLDPHQQFTSEERQNCRGGHLGDEVPKSRISDDRH
jgi:DNA-binding CsgD family transcriptional regulator